MLRIYFTTDDVARTRLADGADPLWEVALSMHMLRRQPGDLLFGKWREATIAGLLQHSDKHILRFLRTLYPLEGYFPDFLTPFAAQKGLDHGLEAIMSAPASTLRSELRLLAAHQKVPSEAMALASGDTTMLTKVADGLRQFHDRAISPFKQHIDRDVEADRVRRVNAMLKGGIEGLLKSFSPMAEWGNGELCIPNHRAQEIHLNGRGLLLIPSYFCLIRPLTLFDPSMPPVLIYPVSRSVPDASAAGQRALEALIGKTRANVLLELHIGLSTLDLARRLGISPATASEHAAVLRAAGLIASSRDRNKMIHRITETGRALVHPSSQ